MRDGGLGVTEPEALDLFSLLSLVHRCLDALVVDVAAG